MASDNSPLHNSESLPHLSSISSMNSEIDEKEFRSILGDLEATSKYWENKLRYTNDPEFVATPHSRSNDVLQPAMIVRRRNAYMKLDNQMATAYFSSEFSEQTLSTFVNHIVLDISATRRQNTCMSSESPTTIIEGDILAYAYRICIWFLEKKEIRDLLFNKIRNIEVTLLTIFESVVEFLHYCVLQNIRSPSSHHHLVCYGCTLLQSLFSYSSGKHAVWSNASNCQGVVSIMEKILQINLPKLESITAEGGKKNILSYERLLSLINVALDTLLSLVSLYQTIEQMRVDKKGPYWIVLVLPFLLHPELKGKIIELLNKSLTLTPTLQSEIADAVYRSCNTSKMVDKIVDRYYSCVNEEDKLYAVQLWTNIVRLLAPNLQKSLHIFNKLFRISKDAFVKATPVIRIAMFRGWQEFFDECLRHNHLNPKLGANIAQRKINYKKLMHTLSNPLSRRFSKEHDCLVVRKVILEVWVHFITRMGILGLLDECIEELLLPFCKLLQKENNIELVTTICRTFALAAGRDGSCPPLRSTETKTNLPKRRKLDSTTAEKYTKGAEIGRLKLVPLSASNTIRLLESLKRFCQDSSFSKEKKRIIASYNFVRGHIDELNEDSTKLNRLIKHSSHPVDMLGSDTNVVETLKLRVQELERTNKTLRNIIQNMRNDGAKVLL